MSLPNLPLNIEKARHLYGRKVKCTTLQGPQSANNVYLALVDNDEELLAIAILGKGVVLKPGDQFEASVSSVTWDRIELNTGWNPTIIGWTALPPGLLERLSQPSNENIEDVLLPRAVRNACKLLGLHYSNLTPELIEEGWYKKTNPPAGIHPSFSGMKGGAPYLNNAKSVLLEWLNNGQPKSSLSADLTK